MTNDFSNWLSEHGLEEVITTHAGDSFYANVDKKFGVLKKNGEYGVQSFYLDDIIGFRTYDDENLVVEWSKATSWRMLERKLNFSTNEVFMEIYLKNQVKYKLQIFRATTGNIKRNNDNHVKLFNYAYQISQILYKLLSNLS